MVGDERGWKVEKQEETKAVEAEVEEEKREREGGHLAIKNTY